VLHELTGREVGLLYLLFPHLSGLDLDRVEDLGGSVKIVARTGPGPVACRACGTLSARVHDRTGAVCRIWPVAGGPSRSNWRSAASSAATRPARWRRSPSR
jgi:hypothetical protein